MRGFVRWYDTIYAHKNYQQDIKTILYFLNQFSAAQKDVLEIGAGTGNHTLLLSQFAQNVLAIESDVEMAAVGKDKTAHLNQVNWHVGMLETASSYSADVAVALFNMINYLLDEGALTTFLRHLYKRMKANSIFIFDCWNGNLPRVSDSREERRTSMVNNLKIEKNLMTTIDVSKKFAELNYRIKIFDEGQYQEEILERLKIRLWTIEELIEIGEAVSFKVEAIRSHHQPESPVELSSTNLWIVFKKE